MNEDLSNIFEKLNINKDAISPEAINNLIGMFNKTSSATEDNSTETNSSSNVDIDIDTIIKIKSILDKINTKNDNPRIKLLYDLKPFLNDSKKNKLEQYIKMDKMAQLLPLIGGDFNTRLYSDDKVLLFSLISLLF